MITNKFDNNCAACGETAWTGEKVYYAHNGEPGKKIRHERCGDFPRDDKGKTVDISLPSKACKKCGEVKPLTEYSKHSKSPDGKQPYCNVCNRAYNKEYARKRVETKKVTTAPVVLEGNEAIADKLGITVQTLLNMPFGEVAEFLAMAEKLDRLRSGIR